MTGPDPGVDIGDLVKLPTGEVGFVVEFRAVYGTLEVVVDEIPSRAQLRAYPWQGDVLEKLK